MDSLNLGFMMLSGCVLGLGIYLANSGYVYWVDANKMLAEIKERQTNCKATLKEIKEYEAECETMRSKIKPSCCACGDWMLPR